MTKYDISELVNNFNYKQYKEEEISLFLNLDIDNEKIKKLIEYKNLLMEVNKTVNLTAIRDDIEVIKKHFIDSIHLNKYIQNKGNKILDIGTGAGFPGLVLAILNDDKDFVLVDSTSKKTEFLKLVVNTLNLKNVKVLCERFEEIDKQYFEYFDIALCRGVAHLSIITEYVAPFLKVNGIFLPQKQNTHELDEIENTKNILYFEVLDNYKLSDDRYVFCLKKLKKTPSKFPRSNGFAKKNPLW